MTTKSELLEERTKLINEVSELLEERIKLRQQVAGMAKHIDELEHDISEIKYLDKSKLKELLHRVKYAHRGLEEVEEILGNFAIPTREKIDCYNKEGNIINDKEE